ncbi:flagella biosynthesis regulatory protein FliT [Mixta calida]|uniref:Flagellar protein FliT n=1 Tax=Mixta calida TaxID=665913 RepID=A0ABN5HAM9_9GAMM|nr:flagella biosynthesis regulatory protein FliT [Mixta calida]AIX73350.1 flagellar biosynthesis protein FliT [Pantoea sp. PSNIH2]MBS6060046.1 flagella biosynthesis regulatory protein FliT [Pantoea sp.]POU40763.1 flagella biosynthesis regulatory protein FliT [Pantoea sp. PSNIH5]POU59061.1 flagella biosynthesis regulatory protein FliT [Pantoea sp. PSNIH4]POY65348.1 flagella biosynthesis regulatory protein FliT [Pantoea sp. PSNIH3]HCW46665.1 flagella biosynthesis regulatory protein FliT [Erwini
MSDNLDVLRRYQQLLMLSNTMLSLAKQGQWDALIGHEVGYLQAVESISHAVDAAALPAAAQAQIRPLLRQLLDNETLIKSLLANRMDELRTLVNQGSQQQNITSAYGRFSGNILYPSDS